MGNAFQIIKNDQKKTILSVDQKGEIFLQTFFRVQNLKTGLHIKAFDPSQHLIDPEIRSI